HPAADNSSPRRRDGLEQRVPGGARPGEPVRCDRRPVARHRSHSGIRLRAQRAVGTLQLRPFVAGERPAMRIRLGHQRNTAISDLLDRALNKGVVLWGEATISLAGVELVYVGLKVLVSSVETMRTIRSMHPGGAPLLDEGGA